MKSIYCVEE